MKIKYFDKEMPRISKILNGDWIDLRVNEVCVCKNSKNEISYALKNRSVDQWYREWYETTEPSNNTISYNEGNVIIVRLGVAMQLPINHEAEVKPRSSAFKEYGLLLTNSVGCIDQSYCGNEDEWIAVFYATRNGLIARYDRIVQFRINEKMPPIQFIEVDELNNENRGGFGSTGTK